MAKLTKEQWKKINAACENGFRLDLNFFGIWGEKRLEKHIKKDDFVIEAILDFYDEYEGEGYRREKVGIKAHIIVNKLIPGYTEGVYRVLQISNEIASNELLKRKSMKKLQELTSVFTDEKIEEKFNSVAA